MLTANKFVDIAVHTKANEDDKVLRMYNDLAPSLGTLNHDDPTAFTRALCTFKGAFSVDELGKRLWEQAVPRLTDAVKTTIMEIVSINPAEGIVIMRRFDSENVKKNAKSMKACIDCTNLLVDFDKLKHEAMKYSRWSGNQEESRSANQFQTSNT